MRLLVSIVLSSWALRGVLAETLQVHHRLLDPRNFGASAWSKRGTIEVQNDGAPIPPTFAPSEAGSVELKSWLDQSSQALGDDQGSNNAILYQVALQRSEGDPPSDWDFQSVKMCHVSSATTDIISLLRSPAGDIWGFDYYVAPIPRDGSCPKTPRLTSPAQPLSSTTVAFRDRDHSPQTVLRKPPPMTAEGKPIVPPVERSFLQKNWTYILAGVLILMVAIPGPEEETPPAKK
ncbi:hypothetical protein FRB96_000001 [Tulasnella sp. 330]|nr:hypothetical protein FRB96_000001 [Tulasnella sp. 330]KAG8882652.1 hypothetical protein FRB97_007998 [Tulasnella sp. 331]KAG8890472.1 hypothetical protein FRB98_007819 [Tulasnella sp. 332]